MQRRRFRQTESPESRLAEEAKRLREEAKLLPSGALRDELIRKARQAETGMTEWLTSPGASAAGVNWTGDGRYPMCDREFLERSIAEHLKRVYAGTDLTIEMVRRSREQLAKSQDLLQSTEVPKVWHPEQP